MASNALRFLDLDDALPQPIAYSHNILDKTVGNKQYVNYMLDRTNQMFEYEGLPETIPAYMLELYLQIFGYAAFVKIEEGKTIDGFSHTETPAGIYIFFGGIGGERDIYYRPTLFIAANPRLKSSVNCTIVYEKYQIPASKNPCVLMRNDTNYMGLLPLYSRYASEMVENDISIRSAQINARAQVAICATTDRDKEGARKYIDDLEAGKIGVMAGAAFLEGISTSNLSTQSSNTIIQLIELQQYLKASWYNELGLNVNFNMKREYMSEEEIAVNTDILLPLVDDMLNCRQQAVDLLNEMFDLNIKVRKNSAWANKEREEQAAIAEAEQGAGMEVDDAQDQTAESAEQKEQVSPDVQPEVRQGEVQSTEQPDGVSGEQGDEHQDSADVTVAVSINVEGGDSDVSEPQEKPEESDAE